QNRKTDHCAIYDIRPCAARRTGGEFARIQSSQRDDPLGRPGEIAALSKPVQIVDETIEIRFGAPLDRVHLVDAWCGIPIQLLKHARRVGSVIRELDVETVPCRIGARYG